MIKKKSSESRNCPKILLLLLLLIEDLTLWVFFLIFRIISDYEGKMNAKSVFPVKYISKRVKPIPV